MEINEHFETVCDSRKETRGKVLQNLERDVL